MAKRKAPKGPVNLDVPDFGNTDELFDSSEIDLSVFDIVGDDSGTRATVRGQSQQGWDASDDVPF